MSDVQRWLVGVCRAEFGLVRAVRVVVEAAWYRRYLRIHFYHRSAVLTLANCTCAGQPRRTTEPVRRPGMRESHSQGSPESGSKSHCPKAVVQSPPPEVRLRSPPLTQKSAAAAPRGPTCLVDRYLFFRNGIKPLSCAPHHRRIILLYLGKDQIDSSHSGAQFAWAGR